MVKQAARKEKTEVAGATEEVMAEDWSKGMKQQKGGMVSSSLSQLKTKPM